MGQYYKPVILGTNKKTVNLFMESWDYGNGAKLMEHSWIKNQFVMRFEALIHKNPQIVVWAGDYADNCKRLKTNIYDRCLDKLKHKAEVILGIRQSRYVINHTKQLFVDKSKVPNVSGWKIHPLPLLTCDGNGRGGGDFGREDPSGLVGSWARDLISVDSCKPKGYTEILFDLKED